MTCFDMDFQELYETWIEILLLLFVYANRYMIDPATFAVQSVFPSLNYFYTFVKNKLDIFW